MKKVKPLITPEEIEFELMMEARERILAQEALQDLKEDKNNFIDFDEYLASRFTPEELKEIKQEALEEVSRDTIGEECCVCHEEIYSEMDDAQYDKYSDTWYCSSECMDERSI